MSKNYDLTVIGGGLAGSEAAWQAAQQGLRVALYEMRPSLQTGAHTGAYLAELVCSNSLGSILPDRAAGLLKYELSRLGSLLLKIAQETAVPAGGALAVDRDDFARKVTYSIENHPKIDVIREEVKSIPDTPVIVASGPLTSPALSNAIISLANQENLYFYDAIAPIISSDTINMTIAYRASRYGRGDQQEGDYINCPLTRDEYERFVDALLSAERIELRDFEKEIENGVRAGVHHFFEGCLPIEILAQRGRGALAFGPMRPVGLIDSRFDKRPYAVVQLRQDDLAGTLYNLVGFQTNLKYGEQERVFRMIPGLECANIVRHGQMHRNTFIYSPGLLVKTLQFHDRSDLFFAGQITGVEGYVGNIATGLLAGVNAARLIKGIQPLVEFPTTTMIGALCHYITHASLADFQPMKANFGLLPEFAIVETHHKKDKRQRALAFVERARRDLEQYLGEVGIMFPV